MDRGVKGLTIKEVDKDAVLESRPLTLTLRLLGSH